MCIQVCERMRNVAREEFASQEVVVPGGSGGWE